MRYVLSIILCCAIAACTPTYKAEAWFASAPDVKPETPVMVGAQLIGKTAKPTVIAGRLKVPLLLNTPDALPDATIIVIQQDVRGVRLVAHPRGNPLHLSGEPFQFRGAASTPEYWRMLIEDKVEELTR